MSLNDDHFARKLAAQSRAWEQTGDEPKKKEPREPAQPKMGICDKCKQEKLLRSYRSRETVVVAGAASYGTVVRRLCDDCAPRSRKERDVAVPQMDKKQLKGLLRAAQKGLL